MIRGHTIWERRFPLSSPGGVTHDDVISSPARDARPRRRVPRRLRGAARAQLKGHRAPIAAALGALIALALLPWAPAGVPVIAATAAILVGWSR